MNAASSCLRAPTPPAPGADREPLRIDAVRDLPALPAAVLELLDLLGRDDVETGTLAAKIALDQALSAKTLRLANSSFYGMPRHVASIADATSVLGLRTVRVVVTTAALTSSFTPPACEGFDFGAYWRHAVSVAVGAKLVAAAIGEDAEAAFTAGLLHDIGQLVLASGFPERFAQVLAHQAGNGTELRDAEHALLGLDHAAVGALVAEHWHFPNAIVDAIGAHHAPPARAAGTTLIHVVRAADDLVHVLERGAAQGAALPPECVEGWTGLGLTGAGWERLLAET